MLYISINVALIVVFVWFEELKVGVVIACILSVCCDWLLLCCDWLSDTVFRLSCMCMNMIEIVQWLALTIFITCIIIAPIVIIGRCSLLIADSRASVTVRL